MADVVNASEIEVIKGSELPEVTSPEGMTFLGYDENSNPIETKRISFSNMTPLFGVVNNDGDSVTLAPSQYLFTNNRATFLPVSGSRIIISDTQISIGELRYSSPDGKFTNGQPVDITIDSSTNFGIVATIGAMGSTTGITYTKVDDWLWNIEKNLASNQHVLLFRNQGDISSKYNPIQDILYFLNKTREDFYVQNPKSFVVSRTSITIPSDLRLYRNGNYAGRNTVTALSTPADNNVYSVVVTQTAWGNVVDALSVEIKTGNVWITEKSLAPNQYLLCYRDANGWASRYANIQAVLDLNNTISLFTFGRNFFINKTQIVIPQVRTSRWMAFSQSADSTTIPLDNNNCAIVGTITGYGSANSITLAKVNGYHWTIKNTLNRNQFLLCYRHEGYWSSDYPVVQAALPLTNNFTITKKVVKADGTIGVDCDFTNIKEALDSITDNTPFKRYLVEVRNGVYDDSANTDLYLGMLNYVEIVGQSKSGVRVIKRLSGNDVSKAVFDPALYGKEINYSALRNMTIISKGIKSPIHIDTTLINGVIELSDLDLINENTPSEANYLNCLACGLGQNQHVKVQNVRANGKLWAHNKSTHYTGDGCSFKLNNCISKFIVIGDLLTYGNDVCEIKGCKAEYLMFVHFSSASSPLAYLQPSFAFNFSGNNIDYITAPTSDLDIDTFSFASFDSLYNGKWGISDPNIHNYCLASENITRGDLVTLTSETIPTIKKWTDGDRLYGIALDTVLSGDYLSVQYNGVLFINASGTINEGDSIELNSSGYAVKHNSRLIIGFAMSTLSSGTGIIKVKLI